MGKKFIVKIESNKGSINALVDTPDLKEAIELVCDKTAGTFGVDKSKIQPDIFFARIEPLTMDLTTNDK